MEFIGEYEKELEECEEELVAKAHKYSIPIPYKNNQINWPKLSYAVQTREQLLDEALDLNIDIVGNEDDPALIKELIKEEKELESRYRKDVMNYYNNTRGV